MPSDRALPCWWGGLRCLWWREPRRGAPRRPASFPGWGGGPLWPGGALLASSRPAGRGAASRCRVPQRRPDGHAIARGGVTLSPAERPLFPRARPADRVSALTAAIGAITPRSSHRIWRRKRRGRRSYGGHRNRLQHASRLRPAAGVTPPESGARGACGTYAARPGPGATRSPDEEVMRRRSRSPQRDVHTPEYCPYGP